MENNISLYLLSRALTHSDVGVRKLVFEWHACFHRILKAAVNRIGSTIDLEDVVLMRVTALRRDASFHGDTPSVASETLCSDEARCALGRHFPDVQESNLDFVLNRLQFGSTPSNLGSSLHKWHKA